MDITIVTSPHTHTQCFNRKVWDHEEREEDNCQEWGSVLKTSNVNESWTDGETLVPNTISSPSTSWGYHQEINEKRQKVITLEGYPTHKAVEGLEVPLSNALSAPWAMVV